MLKKENERFRRSGESKTKQLKELQDLVEAQAQRLMAMDGRLSQGQGAMEAAFTTKETEIKALKDSISSREQLVRDQAAAVARLDRMVAETEVALVASREREEALEKEQNSLFKALEEMKVQNYEKKREVESSCRTWGEQLSRERKEWNEERSRLIQECNERLEGAEKWIEKAVAEKDQQRRLAEQQVQHVDAQWSQKYDQLLVEYDSRARKEDQVHMERFVEARVEEAVGRYAEKVGKEKELERKIEKLIKCHSKMQKRQGMWCMVFCFAYSSSLFVANTLTGLSFLFVVVVVR